MVRVCCSLHKLPLPLASTADDDQPCEDTLRAMFMWSLRIYVLRRHMATASGKQAAPSGQDGQQAQVISFTKDPVLEDKRPRKMWAGDTISKFVDSTVVTGVPNCTLMQQTWFIVCKHNKESVQYTTIDFVTSSPMPAVGVSVLALCLDPTSWRVQRLEFRIVRCTACPSENPLPLVS